MSRKPDLPCCVCGELRYRSLSSRPEGQAMCRACMRTRSLCGTRAGYQKRGCRCEACRDAVNTYQREYAAKYRAEHGVSVYKASRKPGARGRGGNFVSRQERLSIYERDGWTCQLCGEPVDQDAHPNSERAPSLDHIVCVSWLEHPDDSIENLRTAHRVCNSRRGARDGAQDFAASRAA